LGSEPSTWYTGSTSRGAAKELQSVFHDRFNQKTRFMVGAWWWNLAGTCEAQS
jgi:hypothetical protein